MISEHVKTIISLCIIYLLLIISLKQLKKSDIFDYKIFRLDNFKIIQYQKVVFYTFMFTAHNKEIINARNRKQTQNQLKIK